MIVYPLDRLHEEIAFIAHHYHWPYDQIVNMDHAERRCWVDEITATYVRLQATAGDVASEGAVPRGE